MRNDNDNEASDHNDAYASDLSTSSHHHSRSQTQTQTQKMQIIATADLPVAQPLDEEEAARQDAQIEQEIQQLLELERNAVRINEQVQQAQAQSPSPEDSVVSPASNNDRSYRRLALISGVLVLAAIAVTAVIVIINNDNDIDNTNNNMKGTAVLAETWDAGDLGDWVDYRDALDGNDVITTPLVDNGSLKLQCRSKCSGLTDSHIGVGVGVTLDLSSFAIPAGQYELHVDLSQQVDLYQQVNLYGVCDISMNVYSYVLINNVTLAGYGTVQKGGDCGLSVLENTTLYVPNFTLSAGAGTLQLFSQSYTTCTGITAYWDNLILTELSLLPPQSPPPVTQFLEDWPDASSITEWKNSIVALDGADTTELPIVVSGQLQLRGASKCGSPPYDGVGVGVTRTVDLVAGVYNVGFHLTNEVFYSGADLMGNASIHSISRINGVEVASHITTVQGQASYWNTKTELFSVLVENVTIPGGSTLIELYSEGGDCASFTSYWDNIFLIRQPESTAMPTQEPSEAVAGAVHGTF